MVHFKSISVVVIAALLNSVYTRSHQQKPTPNKRPFFRGFNETRIYPGEATYYDRRSKRDKEFQLVLNVFQSVLAGIGACGISNLAGDFVVAIADALYETQTINGNPNNNRFCNRQIEITGPLGTSRARIVDRCGSCKNVRNECHIIILI